jgi:hypothetical protein
MGPKLYHTGIRSTVSRNNLSNANENRDWRIYAEFAQILIQQAKDLYVDDSAFPDLDATVYAVDPGAYYVMDRGYVDFERLYALHTLKAYFVTRAKKAFYGTSANAVKAQIWIAICVYLLVAITKKRLNIEQSLYTILQILSVSVFEKMPLLQAFQSAGHSEEGGDFCNQLALWN